MNNIPPSIGFPTSTEDVSTLVMATDTPPSATSFAPITSTSLPTPASTTPTSSESSTINGPEGTAGAVGLRDHSTNQRGLSTPQVVGVAVAGAATVLIVLLMLMLAFCIRKRRRERRRSQRRSRIAEPTPPPNYQTPPKSSPPAFGNVNSSLTVPSPQSRFYAASPPLEEKRRSFWRRSIRPEEIGIAVSPKVPMESSPASFTSQHSSSRLLASAPARALWPAPLDVEASRERRRLSQRPTSDATVFDNEPQTRLADSEPIYVDKQPFILEKPPPAKRRQQVPPAPLKLPVVPQYPPRQASKAARIPLTPTYDDGNISVNTLPQSYRSPPTHTTRTRDLPQTATQIPSQVPEHELPLSSIYGKRNVLRKEPPVQGPVRLAHDRPRQIAVQAAVQREREDSVASIYTEIEEDTPPEETDKQLGLHAIPKTPSGIMKNGRGMFPGEESPIKDLRYPQIPRSAAFSRHAEPASQPRPSPIQNSNQSGRHIRDQLVRAGASFMQTDTTSSDGYMSDETIEWPQPPLSETGSRTGTGGYQNTSTSAMARLKNNPNSGNRGMASPIKSLSSLNEALSLQSRGVKVLDMPNSPPSKVRLTPSKSSKGDLYLTVEI
ncbi:uncharacterized protein HMPREF1120_01631 [Exophiala dermatitidis NIH/UT8656]|uniref:Uncharacterized protein n=2 Tax=Exophiala dermatitidis TaxID=5970 RepID=H6BSY9_EXODN|nr:uncharacterized protein HMPREF1120_01631 [Exophiala dermatitidis NIH/UT8656]EHY53438.1 hypothetical protein HMPREF1120_01631 [Exophiala dermatitidis NIH/UT8656]